VGLNLRFDPGEPVYTSRQICRWVSKIVPSVLGIICNEPWARNRAGSPRPRRPACGPGWQGRYSSHDLHNLSQPRRVLRL